MKKNYTDIVILLDRSGSMESVKSDTIGGFNEFVATQKKAHGEATLTLAQFDNVYEVLQEAVPIAQARDLSAGTYAPRGSTALHDAMCRAIDDAGDRLRRLREEDRPEKVVFVTITDGLENASRKHSANDVADRITKQRDTYKWEFVFIGANQDAIATGERIGIRSTHALNYTANSVGTQSAYKATARNMANLRAHLKADMSWTKTDRDEQEKAKV